MERQNFRGLRSWGRGIATLALALGVATAAWADGPPLEGTGVVTAKNAMDQSVTIGAGRYRVTDETRLMNLDARQMTFSAIPVASDDGDGGATNVRFEARSAGGDLPELEVLQVVPQLR